MCACVSARSAIHLAIWPPRFGHTWDLGFGRLTPEFHGAGLQVLADALDDLTRMVHAFEDQRPGFVILQSDAQPADVESLAETAEFDLHSVHLVQVHARPAGMAKAAFEEKAPTQSRCPRQPEATPSPSVRPRVQAMPVGQAEPHPPASSFS